MSRIMDAELRNLSTIIYKMGDLAYQAVSMAIYESLYGRDSYDRIKEISDTLILLADQVEDKIFEIIIRFQPVASDLRIVKSYMKISYDITRLGRYALDISYINKRFGGLGGSEEWIRTYIADMSEKALSMVKMVMEILRSQKIEVIKSVSEMEEEIDKLYINFLNKIIDETNIKSRVVVSSVLVIRYFERIADHVAYMCESIIYMLTGRKEFLR
ncbi:MAG: PhoU domain-containing protein [Nitrososphaerota archaeon]|nr:hypothetical protein [Candidatus Bathyarchaeota archaeon]MCX8162730.1 hypothetical protein [Candidatus Bathyarchaeota archaeon]MDW8061206.1 PhoU domain-containing protein [Nitrososphaerota archaeon]